MKQLNDDAVDTIAVNLTTDIMEFLGILPEEDEHSWEEVFNMVVNALEPYSNGERNWN